MKSIAIVTLLALVTFAAAQANGGPPFDPAGAPHVGNGVGPSGICSGLGAQTQAGKTGCGFGGGGAPAAPPPPPPAANNVAGPGPNVGGPPFDPAGIPHVGNGAGGQFIGGQCLSAADCGSGCCAGPSGICSGVGAQTQAGKTGCGFAAKRFFSRRTAL
ncbi:hypothetical protein B0H17DRAFT_318690 [Mycena rosella]|uniref:Biotrophy-associated secreted protein 2 n=1 Tax=Mycena rosella TaxID=1033263 RepID=A0AAD7CU85_MYCRO|nr:hypothetical protein B0H17DRAFT_318690 [Mycena rosella]